MCFVDQSDNTGPINEKRDGSVLQQKLSFTMLGLSFSSEMDFGSYNISIAKIASKKIGILIHSMFLSSEVALCLCKSSHVWNGAPTWYLEMLCKLQKHI